MKQYANALIQDKPPGICLRTLQFCGPAEFSAQDIHQILLCSPRLTRICGVQFSSDTDSENVEDGMNALHIPWYSFEALAHTSGPVIEAIEDVFITGVVSNTPCPSIFGRFSALRSLKCQISAQFMGNIDKVSPSYLSNLVSLCLWLHNSSFLDVLSSLE
jgi:hypothetical protein